MFGLAGVKRAIADVKDGMESFNSSIASLSGSMKKLGDPVIIQPVLSNLKQLDEGFKTYASNISATVEGIKKSLVELANPLAAPVTSGVLAVNAIVPENASSDTLAGGEGTSVSAPEASAPGTDATGAGQGPGSAPGGGTPSDVPSDAPTKDEKKLPHTAPPRQEIIDAAVLKLDKDLTEALKNILAGRGKWEDLVKIVVNGAKEMQVALANALTAPDATQWLAKIGEDTKEGLGNLFNSTVNWIKGKEKFGGVEDAFRDLRNTARLTLDNLAKQEMNRFVDNFMKALLSGQDAFQSFGENISALFKSVGDTVSKVVDGAKAIWNFLSGNKKKKVDTAVPGTPGTAPQIPPQNPAQDQLETINKTETETANKGIENTSQTGQVAVQKTGETAQKAAKTTAHSAMADIGAMAMQAVGMMNLFSGDKKKRRKSWFGGLVGGLASALIPGIGSAFQGLLYGSAFGGAMFDNPINDSMAVRAGQALSPSKLRSNDDLVRLVGRGVMANSPTSVGAVPASGNTINHYHNIQVSTNVEKMTSIQDLERMSETQAWIISKRLKLVTNGA
ncbi:MAG: hypothetical protein ACYC2Y_10975 [Armatimonadota bacterium]